MFHFHRQAFTLVELSIVLVILGLLVGGVLSGQSLIHAAELRAVTREYGQYKTAMGAFKDKYLALPGDMNNAVKYWGAQAGGNADGIDGTCAALSTAATGTATCNGNGDGLVLNLLAPTPLTHELFRFWQHLANAGLVEGTFTGVMGSAGNWDSVIGQNIPRSKITSAGWLMMGLGTYSDSNYFSADYGNAFVLGGYVPNAGPYAGVMKAEDAYNIDMKMDDGKPNTGSVLSYKYALLPNCATSTNDAYNLQNTAIGCSLIIKSGY